MKLKKQKSIAKKEPNPLHEWFKYLFEQRMDKDGYVKCFECGRNMHQDTYKELSTCYSHILPKSKYPKLEGEESNVVITCPDCHYLFTMSPKKAINQYKLYLEMKEKYNLT